MAVSDHNKDYGDGRASRTQYLPARVAKTGFEVLRVSLWVGPSDGVETELFAWLIFIWCDK